MDDEVVRSTHRDVLVDLQPLPLYILHFSATSPHDDFILRLRRAYQHISIYQPLKEVLSGNLYIS